MGDARTSVLDFDNLFLRDPPELSPAKEIEAPLERRFNPPRFIADLSGKRHPLNIPNRQRIHGSYLRQRSDVMLFGSSNIVSREGDWTNEVREGKGVYLSYMDMYFFKNLFPGDSPKINDVRGTPSISTVEIAAKGTAKYLDEPVFLATPLEPPVWGRWVANVIPRIHHYLTYGQGRKFLCHVEKPWQRATLISLGVPEDNIVHHEPGSTYLCQDIIAVEYSGSVLPLSLGDRAMMNNLVQRHRVKSPFGKKLFVSRVTQTKKNPNYRPLLNEAELIDLMKEEGFDIIEPELFSLPEQMSAFREAEVVVFVGGSSLFNTAFCEPGTKVVTIEASTTFISTHMEYLSALEVDYGVVFGREDPEDNRPRHRRWTVDVHSAWEAIEPMTHD